jgi:2-C-methyl-D-erythritol 2,4-cyclodiphosphate synthase
MLTIQASSQILKNMFRVGFGQDSHRFSEDECRKLVLGGVVVEGEKGLEGNSDGDAVLHAICRALEQAIGGESFSIYADEMSRQGINDSVEYLKIAAKHVREAGYAVNNLGISIEGKRPKIIPLEKKMKNKLAEILEIAESQIGINATSGEDLTAFGRGEGIQVFTIVSLLKK